MKKIVLMVATAAASTFSVTNALAEEASPHSFSSNVGIFSQYVFRGITYSDERPALQGGFDYAHDNGLYAGIWGSTLEEDDNSGNSLEVDF